MKRIVTIVLIVLILIVATLVAIPVFFKQNMLDYAQKTLNSQIDAEVELGDLKLSLFRNFPQVSVELNSLLVKGKGTFQNDTLLLIDVLRTSTSLKSLFRPSNMQLDEIIISGARLNLLVDTSGESNWNLVEAKSVETDTSSSRSEDNFSLQLDKIQIRKAAFKYTDRGSDMTLMLDDLDFDISGQMYGSSSQLNTKGSVGDFSLSYAGVNYISKTTLAVNTLLNADFETMSFTVAENELLVNRLPMQVHGGIMMPSDSVQFDLQLQTVSSDFDNFLALVPPVYADVLKDISTGGSASINGAVKGYYYGESYPSIHLEAKIDDGNFQYAGMPEKIEKIRARVNIDKPQGIFDLTTIKVDEAHAEIRNNPVDLLLTVSNPVSDPFFDGTLIGKVNLLHLKNAMPLDSVNIAGVVDANIMSKGHYSDIETENYQRIKSDGAVLLDNFVYQSPKLSKDILVPQGRLDFSPQKINLTRFQLLVGQSDFELSGELRDYLAYLFSKGTIKGDLRLASQHANLNELLRLQVQDESVIASTNPASDKQVEPEELAFDIPPRIDLSLRSNIQTAVINRIPIENVNGLIIARDEKLTLDNLNMDMLEGKVEMTGSYQNSPDNRPMFNFGFDLSKIDIPTMYHTLSGIRKLMPMSGSSTGKISSDFKMSGRLDQQLQLIPATINGNGKLSSNNLQIMDSPVFNQLSNIVKKEKLRNVQVDDFSASFNVENGNLLIKPFTTKVIGQQTTVTGSLNVDNLIDMRLDFIVERDAFGPDIQKILAVIPGNQKIKELPAGVNITGPVGDPKVSPDLSETTKAVADATKDDLKDSLDKLGKGILKMFEK